MVQLVQEARGLDSHERLVSKVRAASYNRRSTHALCAQFYGAKDHPSAKLIDQICKEEVRHVHLGVKVHPRCLLTRSHRANSGSSTCARSGASIQ